MEISDQRYILQPKLTADIELRCFFVDQKKWFLRKNKNAKGTHHYTQDNFTEASIHEQKLISSHSKKIIQRCGYFYGAVDFLVSNDQPYFLELNANPGFESIEKLGIENIAKTLLTKMVNHKN